MADDTVKTGAGCDAIEENESAVEDGRIKVRDTDRMTPRRIIRNVIVLSVVFMFHTLSFGGLYTMQSSLHHIEGMGTTTQSLLSACMIISSVFLPKLATQKLGHKQCVSLAMIGYIVWMAANGYAVWWTMVPASMLVGVCAGPYYTAANSYITILGKDYAQITRQKDEAVLTHFFGIYNMTIMISGLFSPVISSTVLRQFPAENFTGPSEEDLALCGINDCPSNNFTHNINLQKPAEKLVWTLVGIYIGIAIIAFIISVVFLDAIPTYFFQNSEKISITDGLQATCRQMIRPKQILLIPLSVYAGLSWAFKLADWNKSFITCNLGIWMVGYTGIVFCAANAAMSYLSGKLVKFTGLIPIFLFGMCIEIGLILTFIFWTPNPADLVVFFILSVLHGVSDGIWQTQSRAIHGVIFSDNSEAAFSTLTVWKCIGSFIGFGYSSHLCMIYKLYVLLVNIVVAVLCYCMVDRMLRAEKAKSKSTQSEAEIIGLNTTEKNSS